MTPEYLVTLPVTALLAGTVLQLLLAPVLPARGKGWLAFLSAAVSLAGVLALWPAASAPGGIDLTLAAWDGPIAVALHVDGLSQVFAFIAAGIGAAVLLYSVAYMSHDPGATRFYALMQVFIAGLITLVYSADLILLYLGWEMIGLCSFLLVGFWYQDRAAAAGARKVLAITHLAGYGLLASILIIYVSSGTTLWTDPRVAASLNTGLFVLILVAAFAKSVQFPLHTWIPDAMAAPTPVSALLHAACYVKAGVYLVARLHSLGPWPAEWQALVIWGGSLTLLVGALFAMVQTDLKRLLAFSTVSQIGYMMLGLGLGTPLGVAAGLLHCLNHAFFKGGLFLCAGALQHATGTRDMDRLGGLAGRMPRTLGLWLVLAGGIAGVPLLSGFVSKWLIYAAALQAGEPLAALLAWLGSILTVFYFLKATTGVFMGQPASETETAHEAPLSMLTGAGALAAGTVVLGVLPQLAVDYVINPALPALGLTTAIQVSWLGLTIAGGSWYATGGLILAVAAVGLAGLLYLATRPAMRVVAVGGTGVFTGGEPIAGGGHLPASDFSLIVRQGLAPFFAWADPDRYYLALWRYLLAAVRALGAASAWLEARAVAALVALAAVVALVAGLSTSAGQTTVHHAGLLMPWPLPAAVSVALLALLLASLADVAASQRLALLAAAGVLAVAGLLVENAFARVALLETASIVALALVWRGRASRGAVAAYALAVALSALALLSGTLLLEQGSPALVTALLVAGFALKIALVPAYLWLPLVAEATPALVVGLIVAVVDVAALGELLLLRQAAPWLFAGGVWLGLGLLSLVLGGALALSQREIKRMLAFSTVADMGLIVSALTLGGELGLGGAMLGAAAHALAKALLFASLTGPEESGVSLTLGERGVAARFPRAGAAFLVGMLATLGVPPLLGYAAHWRMLAVVAGAGMLPLALALLGSGLLLLTYLRWLALWWWGPGEERAETEPPLRTAALAGLSLLLILSGLWPGGWLG